MKNLKATLSYIVILSFFTISTLTSCSDSDIKPITLEHTIWQLKSVFAKYYDKNDELITEISIPTDQYWANDKMDELSFTETHIRYSYTDETVPEFPVVLVDSVAYRTDGDKIIYTDKETGKESILGHYSLGENDLSIVSVEKSSSGKSETFLNYKKKK